MKSFLTRLESTKLYRFISALIHLDRFKRDIATYRPNLSKKQSLVLLFKVIRAYVKGLWSPAEFFTNDYEHMTKAERRDFVSNYEYFAFRKPFIRLEACEITEDKWKSYEYFRDYFKRKSFLIPAKETKSVDVVLSEFVEFVESCDDGSKKFIIKPLSLDSGIGIRVLMVDEEANAPFIASLMEEYPKGAIVEEFIRQADAVGKYHPQSVNTLRINTIRTDEGVHIFLPFLRIGRSGKIVDNTHNGGILAPFDQKTGILEAASNIDNIVFPIHPDTNCRIEGEQIPMWEEAQRLAIELANKFDLTRLAGWDFALTDKGWVLVEVNAFPGIPVVQKHFRDEFEWLKRQKYSK